jgi:hypothetical protein
MIMTTKVIETEVADDEWDMEDSSPEVTATKSDDSLHVIKLPEDTDNNGVHTDFLAQIVAKHLHSKDLEAKQKKACQKLRLTKHALETIDNLSFLPSAVIYQLGARQVRVSIKDAYRAIDKDKFLAIKKYAPEFAKQAFTAAPVISVKSTQIPASARKEIQEWIEMGRAILMAHKVAEPNNVISFTNKYQPKTTVNSLRQKQDVLVQEGLNSDLPLGTVLTVAKCNTKG